jgi:hypothetical protein
MLCHRAKKAVDGGDERSQAHATMSGQVGPQVLGAAAPLVDRSASVVAGVMQATGRDLDQTFVERGVRTSAVGRPLLLPDLVGLPVKAAVEELDAPQ